MESIDAIATLSALAQATRLDAFRLLVKHEPAGLAAGELARHLEIPQNTMSAHLAVLLRAGLLSSERHSRSIVYRANMAAFQKLALFLVQDCCGGHPDVCVPLLGNLERCMPARTRVAAAKGSSHVR
jgi:DNA-binding transcriptional ArsR family regulator